MTRLYFYLRLMAYIIYASFVYLIITKSSDISALLLSSGRYLGEKASSFFFGIFSELSKPFISLIVQFLVKPLVHVFNIALSAFADPLRNAKLVMEKCLAVVKQVYVALQRLLKQFRSRIVSMLSPVSNQEKMVLQAVKSTIGYSEKAMSSLLDKVGINQNISKQLIEAKQMPAIKKASEVAATGYDSLDKITDGKLKYFLENMLPKLAKEVEDALKDAAKSSFGNTMSNVGSSIAHGFGF